MLRREWAVEQHLQDADRSPRSASHGGRLARHLRTRAHQDDDALRVRRTRVANSRYARPVSSASGPSPPARCPARARSRDWPSRAPGRRCPGCAPCRAPPGGPGVNARSRCARTRSSRSSRGSVRRRAPSRLVDLVRGAEAVHEVEERHPRLERRGLRDQGESCASCTEPARAGRSRSERAAITSCGRRRSTAPAWRSPAPPHGTPSASARRRS
jgi:hypothetical protein